MGKYKLPSGVEVETSDENAAKIAGATKVAKKAAPAKKAAAKSDDKK